MTGTELVTALDTMTGRVTGNTNAIRYINQALKRVARTGVFTHTQSTSNSVLFTTLCKAAFPTDLLSPIKWMYVDGNSSRELTYIPWTEFQVSYPYPEGRGGGSPSYYTRWGRNFIIDCPAPIVYSTGVIASITNVVTTSTIVGTGTTWKTGGLIKVGDYFRMGSTVDTWYPISVITDDLNITVTGLPTPTMGDYEIRTSYATSLWYIANPAVIATTESQPFTGYDDLILAAASYYYYYEQEEYVHAQAKEAQYRTLLQDAIESEKKSFDWGMVKRDTMGSGRTSSFPQGDPFVLEDINLED